MKEKILTLTALLALSLPMHAENWMKRLPDDAYVSTLSIPGSHDSGTGNGFPGITTSIYGPFGDRFARTQDKSFEEQWELGIRAFDLRPCIKDDYINVNHGIMPTNLRFDNALYFLRDKLRENPSEFAIIHLLHASDGDNHASNYGERLLELFGRDDLKDFLAPFKSTLTVREMRGKILLLSRNGYADKPVGGFFRNWYENIDWNAQTNGRIEGADGSTAKLYMQDFSETHRDGDLDRKVAAVRQLLDFSTKHKTSSASDIVWVYNFASAYSKTERLYIPFIVDQEISSSDGYRDNAAHTNAAIIDYLNASTTPGPTGIILADYVGVSSSNGYNTRGQELVDAIIANNFRYLKDMYQVQVSDATYRKPIDMSARIVNPCFNCNMLQGWEGDPFGAVNPMENAEHYNRNFDTYQTITDLPNGVYAVGASAFYRAGEAAEAILHYRTKDPTLRYARIYAKSGNDLLTFPIVSPFSKSVTRTRGVGREVGTKYSSTTYYIPDDMIAAENYMHGLKAYSNVVFVGVTNHKLTIGVRKTGQSESADWCVFDDFTLTYYGNQPEAYRQWLTEMKKRKLSYTNVTVSKPYREAYDAAYSATASSKAEAVAAMKAIDAASEEIAANASLWAEYKQVAKQAEDILSGNDCSEAAKAFLLTFLTNNYKTNLEKLELTNQQLPHAIDELQTYIDMTLSGEWTGIAEVPFADAGLPTPSEPSIYSLDGKAANAIRRHGLYILRNTDGTVRKVLR